jgi:hypothetical protein
LPLGSGEFVVIVKGMEATLMVIESVFWFDCGDDAESSTLKIRFTVPAVVGVPSRTALELNVSPSGSAGEPLARLQVKGGVPPVAAKFVLYAWFTVPAGSEVVVINSGGGAALIVIVSDLVEDC